MSDIGYNASGSKSVADYFKHIVEQGVHMQASDVHIEPFMDNCQLRLRIDGILFGVGDIPRSFFESLVAHIKVLSNLNITERRLPQDGRIIFKIAKQDFDLRVSTLPTCYGESVTVRILDKNQFSWHFNELGIPESMLGFFTSITRNNNGLVVITGPPNSGKTTTIYSLLNQLNTVGRKKILTVEDPVEYTMNGIQQVSIQPDLGLTFEVCLRSFLRQDPNVILVGEIRDEQTAQIAFHTALTGHLVFTTLHTHDSISAIHRLYHLKIDPVLITAALKTVIAQRLIRRLCPLCKKITPSPAEELSLFNLDPTCCTYDPVGCISCYNRGFKGRLGLFEFLEISQDMHALIHQKSPHYQFKKHCNQKGFFTLKCHAKEVLKQGETTPTELLSHLSL